MTVVIIKAIGDVLFLSESFPYVHSLEGKSFSVWVIPSRGKRGGVEMIRDYIHCTKGFGNIFFCYSYCEEVFVVVTLEVGEGINWGVELIRGVNKLRVG